MEMIKEILTAAGVLHRRARFPKPPAESYAVYFDDVEADGADPVSTSTTGGLPRIYHHDVRVELYEAKPDDKTEAAIEAELDARGIPWTKEDRYWLQDVQRYQVLYDFSYTIKK
jgi:hypothetical protein